MTSAATETLNDKHLRRWGIPVIVVATLFGLMPYFYPGRWDLFWKYLIAGLIYTSLTWETCRWVLIRVRQKLPGLHNSRGRILRTSLIFILIAAVGQAILNAIFYYSGMVPPVLAESSFFKLWLINFASALFFVLLNSSIYEAMYFFEQYKNAIIKAENLKKSQTQQKLEALKNRVNPHFLFNSLTTLSALIGEDARLAEQFVDELSKVYRYLLRAGRQANASLKEELQFVESYAFLLKNRFEPGAFSLNIQAGPGIKAEQELPTLALQNALDYLVRTQNAPLHLRISTTATHLEVCCNYQPKALSFTAQDYDWRQLESQAATQEVQDGALKIAIPFTPLPLHP